MGKKFKFELGAEVKIEISGEQGTIIGRAEYAESANCYYLRYKTTDGRAIESWWGESALTL